MHPRQSNGFDSVDAKSMLEMTALNHEGEENILSESELEAGAAGLIAWKEQERAREEEEKRRKAEEAARVKAAEEEAAGVNTAQTVDTEGMQTDDDAAPVAVQAPSGERSAGSNTRTGNMRQGRGVDTDTAAERAEKRAELADREIDPRSGGHILHQYICIYGYI